MQGKCLAELKQPQKSVELLEAALALASEVQASALAYDLAGLYLGLGQQDKALQTLNQLISSAQPFWKAAAQQQLNSIQMVRSPK
jgi:tetratricopeptide (TPR) repeat protein